MEELKYWCATPFLERNRRKGKAMVKRVEYDNRGRVEDSRATVEVTGDVMGETQAAYKFYDGTTMCWLPKSQCEWDGKGNMEMPEWLAKAKGLI
jgi:hypothetical protein